MMQGRTVKADIFTFAQMPTRTQPKYPYPIEWESVAAIHILASRVVGKPTAGNPQEREAISEAWRCR